MADKIFLGRKVRDLGGQSAGRFFRNDVEIIKERVLERVTITRFQ